MANAILNFHFDYLTPSLRAPFKCTDYPKKNFSLSVLSDKVLLPLALLLVQQCHPVPVLVAQCNVFLIEHLCYATKSKFSIFDNWTRNCSHPDNGSGCIADQSKVGT